jgi:hypothetical protein
VRGVSFFLVAAIVTGDAVMVVVVTLSGERIKFRYSFVRLVFPGQKFAAVELWSDSWGHLVV